MKKITLALAAVTLLGGLTLGSGLVSAAPLAVNSLQGDTSGVTPVRMMMKKHMMRKRMMRKRMMRRGM